jgi:hypothetical protein
MAANPALRHPGRRSWAHPVRSVLYLQNDSHIMPDLLAEQIDTLAALASTALPTISVQAARVGRRSTPSQEPYAR